MINRRSFIRRSLGLLGVSVFSKVGAKDEVFLGTKPPPSNTHQALFGTDKMSPSEIGNARYLVWDSDVTQMLSLGYEPVVSGGSQVCSNGDFLWKGEYVRRRKEPKNTQKEAKNTI